MENTTPHRQKTGQKSGTPDKTRLYEYRLKAGLTQAALAEKIGATQRAVSKFEATGAGLGMAKVLAICREVNADIRDLIIE